MLILVLSFKRSHFGLFGLQEYVRLGSGPISAIDKQHLSNQATHTVNAVYTGYPYFIVHILHQNVELSWFKPKSYSLL